MSLKIDLNYARGKL
jgi:hypothetical protein